MGLFFGMIAGGMFVTLTFILTLYCESKIQNNTSGSESFIVKVYKFIRD
tara:strand:+ start:135 stop:281 length:147 start_codon:yes stop_codon:yes gene_type:complete